MKIEKRQVREKLGMSSKVSYINDAHHAGFCKFDGNKGLLLLLVFASLLVLSHSSDAVIW